LSRPGTAPGRVESPDDVVAMSAGCYRLPPVADDATLSASPEAPETNSCGPLERPANPLLLTPQDITNIIGGWLRQCGYLVEGRALPTR
jgi:hypothetical protein